MSAPRLIETRVPERARTVARALARTAEVAHVEVPGGRHAMLRHGRVFDRAASNFVVDTLLGAERRDPMS